MVGREPGIGDAPGQDVEILVVRDEPVEPHLLHHLGGGTVGSGDVLDGNDWPGMLGGWRRRELEPALAPLLAQAPAGR